MNYRKKGIFSKEGDMFFEAFKDISSFIRKP